METSRKIALPRYAEYNAAIKYLVEQGFEATCILQPRLTKHTDELGAKNSPDFVCTPFKTTLGSLIEALEAGADTLIEVYGECRLGYFAELQEQILRDMGYDFTYINLALYDTGKKRDILRACKAINPKVNMAKVAKAGAEAVRMVEHIDEITSLYYENCGFDISGGEYRRTYKKFLAAMYSARNRSDIESGYREAKLRFEEIPINKPEHPLRVGVTGEFYTAMDAFSNLEAEQKLADMGVEVHRWMNISNRMLHYSGEKNLHVQIADLCDYRMGTNSTANLWAARKYAREGFDGIIHIKSANCTPEIDVIPPMQVISREEKVPILFLTYDTQTSDVGLMTRLEAFYDMIAMRKRTVY